MEFTAWTRIREQARKRQGDTNRRLDALIHEQQQTNLLMVQLLNMLGGQQQRPVQRPQPDYQRQMRPVPPGPWPQAR
jgi:hypothetical protein